tara:strand:- start:1209 stop:2045 length:837 start_codon:yes stop_codon:yes gene_type:complete
MPRNEGRLEAKKAKNSPPPVVDNKESIFNFVTPTEFVDLPSKGKFYAEGHPLHNVDSIEIRHMTAKDTDILTSKSLLKKGVAVERMLQNVIVDSDIKVNDLYSGDRNAIIVACRINGFGPNYDVKVTCPNCTATTDHSFDLQEINIKEASDDIEVSENGTFTVTLPRSKVEVECRLFDGNDEKKLFQVSEKRKKLKLPDTTLTEQYKMLIVSLNGETERGLVEKFIDVMPAFDASYLIKMYDKVAPNVDMKHEFACSECEQVSQVNIPFSANFFWPDR